MKKFIWKAYFFIVFLFTLGSVPTSTEEFSAWDLLDSINLIFGILGCIGLAGFVFQKKIGSFSFWKIFLPLLIIWDILLRCILIPSLGEVVFTASEWIITALAIAWFLPQYYAIYHFAYKGIKAQIIEIDPTEITIPRHARVRGTMGNANYKVYPDWHLFFGLLIAIFLPTMGGIFQSFRGEFNTLIILSILAWLIGFFITFRMLSQTIYLSNDHFYFKSIFRIFSSDAFDIEAIDEVRKPSRNLFDITIFNPYRDFIRIKFGEKKCIIKCSQIPEYNKFLEHLSDMSSLNPGKVIQKKSLLYKVIDGGV